ncbi:MAG: hypothetical protein J6S14_17240 [Clostridia bacterium]|nr:hypothetical protein [Clostridia bacterium]
MMMLALVAVLYFAPGFAMYISFWEYGSKPLIFQFLTILPTMGYTICAQVLPKLFRMVSKTIKEHKQKFTFKLKYLLFRTWLSSIPLVFAYTSILLIENKRSIQHRYRRTTNDCAERIYDDFTEDYAF